MSGYASILKKFFLKVLNATLVLVFVTPLVVAFWNSTWNLSALIIFPDNPLIRAWTSTWIGVCSSLMARIVFPYINNVCSNDKVRLILWRCMLYPLSLTGVNCWLGIWTLWNVFTGTHLQSNLISVAVGAFILLVTRLFSNIMGPPGCVGRDSFLRPFIYYTRFQHLQNPTLLVKSLDTVLTCFSTGLGVVSFWRGVWQVQDNLLFPDPSDFVLSATVSLVIGYILCIICFCVNKVYKDFTKDQSQITKYVLECTWIFLIGLSANMSWRGIWYLLDVFIFPDEIVTRCLVLHAAAVLGLYAGGCFSCVTSPPAIGCSLGVDGQEELNGLIMGTILPIATAEFNLPNLTEGEQNLPPENLEIDNTAFAMN